MLQDTTQNDHKQCKNACMNVCKGYRIQHKMLASYAKNNRMQHKMLANYTK